MVDIVHNSSHRVFAVGDYIEVHGDPPEGMWLPGLAILGEPDDDERTFIVLDKEPIKTALYELWGWENFTKAMIGHKRSPFRFLIGWWKCEGSPYGTCVYDIVEDPVMDHCLYCGEPHERK